MDIVERVKLSLLEMGAKPVLWLLIALSVISLAIVFERAWVFASARDDLARLRRELADLLRAGDRSLARQRLRRARGIEASVVLAGLDEADGGAAAAEQAMTGELAVQRQRLERRLAYLGTLGNNAPFVGLFGTVIGIIESFERLGQAAQAPGAAAQNASASVMSGIAEALVATAIGLAVAIPAVVAFNYFQRLIKSRVAGTEALSAVLLAHLAAGTPAKSAG